MNLHATRGGVSPQPDRARGDGDAASPIDLAHLRRYTLADRELEIELLRLFHSQADLQLKALYAAPNVNAWREAAHTLKGSAMGVGAFAVAEAAAQAEQLAGGPSDACAPGCLQALEGAVRIAQDHISSLTALA